MPPQPPTGGFENPRLDLGASIEYGWKKFTENVGGLIVVMVAVGVIAVIVAVVIGLLSATPQYAGAGLSFMSMLWNVVLQVLLAAVIVALGSVLLRAVLGITRGVAITSESVTKTDNLVPYMITMVVVSVVPAAIQGLLGWVWIGLGILIYPLIFIWHIIMGFAPLITLDTGAEPIEAMKKSMDWVTNDIGTTGVIVLVTGIVSVIGALACGIGLLVSVPVGMLALAYTYRARNNEMVYA